MYTFFVFHFFFNSKEMSRDCTTTDEAVWCADCANLIEVSRFGIFCRYCDKKEKTIIGGHKSEMENCDEYMPKWDKAIRQKTTL
jgi:hypothetical protein